MRNFNFLTGLGLKGPSSVGKSVLSQDVSGLVYIVSCGILMT